MIPNSGVVACLVLAAACAHDVPPAAEPIRPEPVASDPAPARIDPRGKGYAEVPGRSGVTVFQLEDDDFIRLGAEAHFPVPPEAVLGALLDYAHHPDVLERVTESKILSKGTDWMKVYQRLSLPLIDDRDFTMRVNWGAEGDDRWIRYRATGGPSERPGVIRVTRNHGGWQLLARLDGRATLARLESNIDMAGVLPTWMSRSGAAAELPDLFLGICKLLEPKLEGRPCPATQQE